MLNKLDILSGLAEVRICVGYEVDGGGRRRWPLSVAELERAEPVYETFPGWDAGPRAASAGLGRAARSRRAPIVDALEELAGVPITLVSVGPERTQTIVRGPRRAIAAGRRERRGMTRRDRAGVAVPGTILIVGGGGREHALAWRLARDPGVERVLVAPGNPGMADATPCSRPSPGQRLGWRSSRLARAIEADLVVIGPEAPLVAGLADRAPGRRRGGLRAERRGGTARGQQGVLPRGGLAAGVPMADGAAFTDAIAAVLYAQGARRSGRRQGRRAGRGQGRRRVRHARRGAPGDPGRAPRAGLRRGRQPRRRRARARRARRPASSRSATHDRAGAARRARPQAHRRGDDGPNTGGMGAISPPADLPDSAMASVRARRSTGRSWPSWPSAAVHSGAPSSRA